MVLTWSNQHTSQPSLPLPGWIPLWLQPQNMVSKDVRSEFHALIPNGSTHSHTITDDRLVFVTPSFSIHFLSIYEEHICLCCH